MAFYRDPREFLREHAQFPFSSHFEHQNAVVAHYHEMIELQYFISGSGVVFLGNNSYTVTEGDLLVINSGEIHSLYAEEDMSYIVVQIDPDFLYTSDKTASQIRYVYPFLLSGSENTIIFTKEESDKLNAGELMRDILEECTRMGFGFELSVKGNLFKLFFGILEYLEELGRITDMETLFEQNSTNSFYKIFDFVKNNYGSDITAKDAAKLANLSYSYFSRLFNRIANTSFREYLNTVRIAKSEQLLIDTDKSVTDIAMECGFCTSSYYILRFKEKNNISPLGFRKKFKGK